jgi:chitin synthase
LGFLQVFLSHAAFHALEDYLRAQDTEEVKRNRMRDQEAAAGLDARDMSDPYAPYLTPHDAPNSPFAGGGGYGDPFNQSSQQLPLIGHNAPTHRANMYEDEYDDQKSTRSEDFDARTRLTSRDDASAVGSESYAPSRNMFQAGDRKALMEKEVLPGEINEGETAEVIKESSTRRRWVALCWILTWWVPNFALTHVGRMKRLDIRQAWREKLAINILIWFLCACAIFVIAALGPIICPTEHIFDSTEIKSHTVKNTPNQVYTSIRGEVFDLTQLAQTHQLVVPVVPQKSLLNYGGNDASDIFPVQVSALCNGRTGSVSPYVNLDPSNRTDDNAQYHDFRFFTNDPRPDWYFEVMTQMRWNYRVGFVGYPPKALKQMAAAGSTVAVYNGLVYDLSPYTKIGPGIQAPSGQSAPSVDKQFMDPSVVSLFQTNAGQDITKRLDSLGIDADTLARQKVCLRNLFTIGKVDNRQSPACQFSTYILLGLSVVMVSIIGFKFIASINLSSARAPENHDKFVICQIPCYTEGEQSIKRTVDSLAMTKYDDKRKLIVVICDGMVIGAGNDKSTPGIVLNVLGHDPAQEPEALSFISLGDGTKQHNMGKVYSGLYEVSGHVVPYLVLCKVGKPSERQKPGNRGKRDTQMLVMSFLNKVCGLRSCQHTLRCSHDFRSTSPRR